MTEAAFHTEIAPNEEMTDVSAIRVRGRATYRESPALRREILDGIASNERPKLVLELSALPATPPGLAPESTGRIEADLFEQLEASLRR